MIPIAVTEPVTLMSFAYALIGGIVGGIVGILTIGMRVGGWKATIEQQQKAEVTARETALQAEAAARNAALQAEALARSTALQAESLARSTALDAERIGRERIHRDIAEINARLEKGTAHLNEIPALAANMKSLSGELKQTNANLSQLVTKEYCKQQHEAQVRLCDERHGK